MTPEHLIKVFKALANDNRLKMLEAIKENTTECSCCPEDVGLFDVKEETICCVDEIVGKFDMAQSTISQHLKELHNAGLLERRKKAQWVYYQINRETFREAAEYLHRMASGITLEK